MVIRRAQTGITYLWILFLVFLLSLGLGKSLEVYSVSVQRQKEAELIYVGGLYREAIRQFYLSTPGRNKRYPERLEDLLKDPRSLTGRRFLRTLYPDPVTGAPFIPVVAPQGGIWGVRSFSTARPLRSGAPLGVSAAEKSVESGYGNWQFVFESQN